MSGFRTLLGISGLVVLTSISWVEVKYIPVDPQIKSINQTKIQIENISSSAVRNLSLQRVWDFELKDAISPLQAQYKSPKNLTLETASITAPVINDGSPKEHAAKEKTKVDSSPKQSVKTASIDPKRTRPNSVKEKNFSTRPNSQSRISRIAGTAEIRFDNAKQIKQWNDVYYATLHETNLLKHCLNGTKNCDDPVLSNWANKIRPLQSLSKMEQVRQVNNLVNEQGYQRDMTLYGQNDYWASPTQFIQNQGDCEDYAILKLASLMALGHDNQDLRIVVGNIKGIGAHAFLYVHIENQELFLDNRSNRITMATNRTDFIPSHSMNFVHRWVHVPNRERVRTI